MPTRQDNGEAAHAFARHFSATGYADIPGEVVEIVKKSVLDTLGVSLAASSLARGCKELAELAKECGGKAESTVLVFGGRVPAPLAAFVNGGLAHGLDFDDIHHDGGFHPSAAVVPAAFAVAERVGSVNGKEFITAIALGHDMVTRMMSSVRGEITSLDWIGTAIHAVFAASATCGRLLGLSQERLHSAIGISLGYSAGAGEVLRSDLRGLYDSWAAWGGVLAALMAQKGIAGPARPLEGDMGFFKVYYGGKYDRDILLGSLGERFPGTRIGYKAWGSCGIGQPSMEAAQKVVQERGLKPEDIEEIRVTVGSRARYLCEPLEQQRKPQSPLDAKFSVPFTVALAATGKRITLGDFSPEAIRDPAVLRLAERVMPVIDPRLGDKQGIPPSIVEIKTKAGKTYSARTDFVYGHYKNPMSMEAIADKFRDCAAYSVKRLSRRRLDTVVDMVRELEQVDDVGKVIRLLG